MHKFKVGDRVNFICGVAHARESNGPATVTEVRNKPGDIFPYRIQPDRDIASGLVDESELTPLFSIGDLGYESDEVETIAGNCSLFDSGWADFYGHHKDIELWKNNFYRGG